MKRGPGFIAPEAHKVTGCKAWIGNVRFLLVPVIWQVISARALLNPVTSSYSCWSLYFHLSMITPVIIIN
jgi:hypothetical protein